MFVDTPPNKSRVVVEAIRLATIVVIPARPSVFDVAAVTETIEICRTMRTPYAVVINAAPAKRNDAEAAIVADARAGLTGIKAPVWSGQITQRSDLCFALGAGAGGEGVRSGLARCGRDRAALERDRALGQGDQRGA